MDGLEAREEVKQENGFWNKLRVVSGYRFIIQF